MKYDFDSIVERRNTGCFKWDRNKVTFGREKVLPMWVADMDFPSPQPVIEAVKKRAEHGVFGYAFATDSCYEAVIEKVERAYNWKIKKEWIVFCDGIVPALYSSVKAFTNIGDRVIIQQPVYHPFRFAIQDNGREIANNKLKFDGERYEMDFADLKMQFNGSNPAEKSSKAKMFILCNPHNPVGRVWTKEELIKLGEECIKNNCIVIADEIHCDLVYKPAEHTCFASINQEFENNSITFIAPSKTFNVAGLSEAVAIIPNASLRDSFIAARAGNNSGNVFGYTALEAAYRYGDEYLSQLLQYLKGNIDYVIKYVEDNIPKIKVIKPEGTYLLWVDMRGLGLSSEELNTFLIEEAGLGLNDGRMFGEGGGGFQRVNIGCPRKFVEEALIKLKDAIERRNL